MSDLIETASFDDLTGKMVIKTTYDSSAVIEANKAAQKDAPETGRYKGDFVLVGRIHMGDVVRLKNLGYNLLSPDPAERKRALLYIQAEEPHQLTVPGQPFARKRALWS